MLISEKHIDFVKFLDNNLADGPKYGFSISVPTDEADFKFS